MAWGLAEDFEEAPTPRLTPGRLTAAAVAMSVVLVAGAAGIVWSHMRSTSASEPPKPSMMAASPPTTTVPLLPTVTIMSQPPVTVTVSAPPAPSVVPAADPNKVDPDTGVSPAQLAAWDSKFLSMMANDGWNAKDGKATARRAHLFCADLTNGVPPAILNQQIANQSGLGVDFALLFTSNAMIVYPGCRAP